MPQQPYVGEIFIAAFNYAPSGFYPCQGQLLSISENDVLFTLIGTTYGGDGQNTFGMPDLRGRMPIGQGQGPGLSPRTLGELDGSEQIQLTVNNLPAHNHALRAASNAGDTPVPTDKLLANTGALDKEYTSSGPVVSMNNASIGNTGSNLPHTNMPPFLSLNFYISAFGFYPPPG